MPTRFYRRGQRLSHQGYDPGPYRVRVPAPRPEKTPREQRAIVHVRPTEAEIAAIEMGHRA